MNPVSRPEVHSPASLLGASAAARVAGALAIVAALWLAVAWAR